MKIIIEFDHGAKRETIEVANADSIETLRLQIYSLTNIPPQEQSWVLNAGASASSSSSSSLNNDAAQIRSLGLKEGQRIIVTRKLTSQSQEQQLKAAQDVLAAFAATMAANPAANAADATAAAPRPAATPRPAPAASASTVPNAYSRASEVSLQGCCSRSFFGTESQVQPGAKAGDKSICFACAQTCHLPRDLKPRPSTSAFVCACAEDHECIFAARSLAAADLLVGLARDQASVALRNAAVQMQEQQLAQGRAEMAARIDMHIKAALEYENPQWQAEARAVIPIDRLRSQAAAAIADGTSQLASEDELMEQLLRWFKHEFFSWTNSPNCDTCGKGTSGIGADRPNASEAPFRPGRVEIYRCESGHITRFPRYNHASKLLQTRRGRCGEWAQAFTLCLRALGIEARAVNDWTDHVWTEYYSEAQKRWIHADSCEARRDAPLLYEAGWGKKLSYIIACSKDELVDVTQRYTKKWNEVLERRTVRTQRRSKFRPQWIAAPETLADAHCLLLAVCCRHVPSSG